MRNNLPEVSDFFKEIYLFMHLLERQRGRKRENAPICWFTFRIPAVARTGLDEAHSHNSIQVLHVGGGNPTAGAIPAASQGQR